MSREAFILAHHINIIVIITGLLAGFGEIFFWLALATLIIVDIIRRKSLGITLIPTTWKGLKNSFFDRFILP